MSIPLSAGHGSLGRVSVFKELGLAVDSHDEPIDTKLGGPSALSSPSTIPSTITRSSDGLPSPPYPNHRQRRRRWYSRAWTYLSSVRPRSRSRSMIAPPSFSVLPTMTHMVMLVVVFVLVLPGVRLSIPFGEVRSRGNGVAAARVPAREQEWRMDEHEGRLEARDDSPTSVCLRWSHQSERSLEGPKRRWISLTGSW